MTLNMLLVNQLFITYSGKLYATLNYLNTLLSFLTNTQLFFK